MMTSLITLNLFLFCALVGVFNDRESFDVDFDDNSDGHIV